MEAMEFMKREQIMEMLYEKYISPTERNKDNYIGVEIEMPVVNLKGEATDYNVTKAVTKEFIESRSFDKVGIDNEGFCYSATDPVTGDNLSFDCSYNNLEFSFAKERSLHNIWNRFSNYITELNDSFSKQGHLLTGMGVNPGYKVNHKDFLPVPRYQMLEGYLKRAKSWEYPMYFHPYTAFGTYACASQVQLDVSKDRLISTIKAFTLLEPIKSLLFSNAWMESEPNNLCVRDMFWENSTHGINPHNVGIFEQIPDSIDELLEYISRTSIFCTERDGHYLFFKPIPIIDYFDKENVEGEYYENGAFHSYSFKPEKSDLSFLRTYKFEDLTYRGTIEYRSACCQPFSDAMTVAAFHVGLQNKTDEIIELLENDKVIYHHGYTPGEMRKLMNNRNLPGFVDSRKLNRLLMKILDLATDGLSKRGLSEEEFLTPLYERDMAPALRMVEGLESGVDMKTFIYEYAELERNKNNKIKVG